MEADGHEVKVSGLYSQQWNAVVSEEDFSTFEKVSTLNMAGASRAAFANNALTQDVSVGLHRFVSIRILAVHNSGYYERLI